MKNIFFVSILLCVLLSRCSVQETIEDIGYSDPTFDLNPPKLMVGITVDQMRYDYLTKYWKDYSDEGFKKLMREGYSCKNHHFSY
ncbi:MAG: alkaline phosphatase family protein, partial [Flavobacteriales bacterium]